MVQLSLLQNEGTSSPYLPNVGFYTDLSSANYHAIDAVSSHRLGLLKKSPAHLRHELKNPTPPTDAMKLGEAIHLAILEPDLFVKTYVVAPKVDGRTKEGKRAKAEFELANRGKSIIDADNYAVCMAMSEACNKHHLANSIIKSATATEVSGFFIDDETKVLCKLRADAICENHDTIFDIKSTLCASPVEFEKSIFNYGYHRQAAWYLDGCAKLGKKLSNYAIIAIEKTAPFCLAVYRLKDEAIELGREENRALVKQYAECLKSNKWAGYPDLVTDVGLPAWAVKQIKKVN